MRDLVVRFPLRDGLRKRFRTAVDGVSLDIPAGTTTALVGESGSGKSTLGLAVLGLIEPTAGTVHFAGSPVFGLRGARELALRRAMQVVFQDPYSSLNPRLTVRETVTEGMEVHGIGRDEADRARRAAELLERTGLTAAALDRYPHEFSGGQRQRVAIARALSVGPRFLVCDEPTSALDVSVQAQILNLLRRLQGESGLTYLFITHNLAVVEYLADRVCVMSEGRIVEEGSVEDVFDQPQSNVTRRMLAARARD